MRRRAFLTGLGGTVVIRPVRACAEKAGVPVVGLLCDGLPESDPDASWVTAFRRGLEQIGFAEGRNVAFEYLWAEGQYDRLPTLAAEFVRRRVAVIAAIGTTPAAVAAKSATGTIPIVFTVGIDPVKAGLVDSLSRPGGNITGVSFLNRAIVEKQLQLLHDAAPETGKIAFLVNPANPFVHSDTKEDEDAAGALGRRLLVVNVAVEKDIATAFISLVQQRVGAFLVAGDLLLYRWRKQLVALSARDAIPSLFPWREAVSIGALMSYGANIAEAFRQSGIYAGRILKGEKPADLPVQQSTEVELAVNLKTAKALGLTVPPSLLAQADEVIE